MKRLTMVLTFALLCGLSGFASAEKEGFDLDQLASQSNADRFIPPSFHPGQFPPIFQGPVLKLTGKLRVYRKGDELGLQLDVKNVGSQPVYGPDMTVDIQQLGFFGDQQLYPYYGGNTSVANTVFPKDMGYIPMTLPEGVKIAIGQVVHMHVQPQGASNFPSFGGDVTACQKGTVGCE